MAYFFSGVCVCLCGAFITDSTLTQSNEKKIKIE